MSTLEKNILKIQKELATKEVNSRSYSKYIHRLNKKYQQLKIFYLYLSLYLNLVSLD